MFGMTKKQLYEGICSEKTLERLEKGKCKAQMAIVAELLHRLLLSAEYLHQEIITEDRELLEEFEQFGYFINHYEFEEVEKWINKIENKIEPDILNIQAIEKYKNWILFYINRISQEQYILKKAKFDTPKVVQKNNFFLDYFGEYVFMSSFAIICHIINLEKGRKYYEIMEKI